jgi:hypothetical protein
MKKYYFSNSAIIIALALGPCLFGQENPHQGPGNNPNVIQPFGVAKNAMLFVSKQSNKATELRGRFQKITDQFEKGTITLSTEGPVKINVNPSEPDAYQPGSIKLSIGTNQNVTWTGSLTADLPSAPAPGFSTPAKIKGTYQIEYAKTLAPGEFADSTWTTTDENGNLRYHGLIRQSGYDEMELMVISMKVDLPEVICLGAAGTRVVMGAQVFPQNIPGASYFWKSLHPSVRIQNARALAPTITLLDTSVKNAQVELEYTIGEISYSARAVVSNCECNCQPIAGNVLIGPLEVAVQVNPLTPTPDAMGHCTYESNNAALKLKMDEMGGVVRMAQVQGVTIGIKRDCDTRALVGATFSWEGKVEMPGLEFQLPTGQKIKTLDLALQKFSLAVDVNGNLNGTTQVLVTNPEDRDLSGGKGVLILRKGTHSTVTFTFSNALNFNGTWDWSGIQNIVVDLIKKDGQQDKVIAGFRGNFNAKGTLEGNLSAKPNAKYRTNQFSITLDELTLGLNASITDGTFSLTHGNGKATISEIKAVKGTFKLNLNFPQAGGCMATVDARNVRAFSMELTDLNLNAAFNRDFDLEKIQGAVKAKHPKFSAKVDVQTFLLENGELKEFRCAGNVKYSRFSFTLENAQYAEEKLNITGKVELKASGVAAMAQIRKFTIDQEGDIGIGGVAGRMRYGPADFSVDLDFKDNGFKGNFSGDFAAIGLNGTLDYGAKENPDYHYIYFDIEARMGIGIPIGNTGLKLTSVGGKAGFNYKLLAFNGPGEPEQGAYLIGLKLGVSDAADMCEVVGEALVAIRNENTDLGVQGTVKVLRRTPYFTGQANVIYTIPANTLKGNVGADLRFPMDGSILRSNNLNIGFYFGNSQFSANGNNMGGELFNGRVKLHQGYFNFNGDLNAPENFTGRLGGRLTSDFQYNDSWLDGFVTLNAQMNINSQADMAVNSSGLSGSLYVEANGLANLTLNSWMYNGNCQAEIAAWGNASYTGGNLQVSGYGRITLPFSIPFYGNVIESPQISFNI